MHEASSTACSETGSVTEHRVARKMSAPGRMRRASTRVREREGKRGTRKKKSKSWTIREGPAEFICHRVMAGNLTTLCIFNTWVCYRTTTNYCRLALASWSCEVWKLHTLRERKNMLEQTLHSATLRCTGLALYCLSAWDCADFWMIKLSTIILIT